MISASVNLADVRRLERRLKALAGQPARHAMRRATGNAATPMVKAAKRLVPRDTDLLWESLGKKGVTYKQSGTVLVLVGPRASVKGTDIYGHKRWPVKYAHMVEFGTRHSAAKPFLRPAFDATAGRAREQMVTLGLKEIEKEARKLAARG